MCFSSISGQRMIPLTRAALDSLMNPKLLDGGKEILEFKQMEQSVGSLQESDSSVSVVYDFICKKETSITRIQTFCGCTVADYQKSPLKIGESGKIIVTYHPKNHPGTVDENIFVYTKESEKQPVARLTLRGEVLESEEKWRHLPYAVGNIRLKRKDVHFSDIRSGYPVVERVLCANIGKVPVELKAVGLPEYVSFHTEPEKLEPGQEGDVVIAIKSQTLSKLNTDRIEFTIKEAGASSEGCTMAIIIGK